MSFYDSVANLILLEVGCVVFLSIEAYTAIKSIGKLETKTEKQRDYILNLFYKYTEAKEKLRQLGINYKYTEAKQKLRQLGINQDIIDSEELDKSLIPGEREIRELAAKDFLSDFSFFGSNLTSMLNSLVIWLEIRDPIMAVIASAIPLTSWILSRRRSMDQMKRNILSYIAISSVVGQIAYFGVSYRIERTNVEWTLEGLLPFFIGFTSGIIPLLILTGDNYKIMIRAFYKPFRLKWNKI